MRNFYKVIWSTTQEVYPNFKKFMVADYSHYTEDVKSKLSVENFFISKDEMIISRLMGTKHKYEIKYSGVRRKKREEYICPRKDKFGLKLLGETGCRYCRDYAAIKRNVNGFQSYCCYPIQINEVTEYHSGCESNDVPVY